MIFDRGTNVFDDKTHLVARVKLATQAREPSLFRFGKLPEAGVRESEFGRTRTTTRRSRIMRTRYAMRAPAG
jgi:hypothetical protein